MSPLLVHSLSKLYKDTTTYMTFIHQSCHQHSRNCLLCKQKLHNQTHLFVEVHPRKYIILPCMTAILYCVVGW